MPRYIIKPVRDEDFYVEYSTIVDAPVEWGTREEFIRDGAEPERLNRADRNGTSALWSYSDKDGVTRRPYDYSDDDIPVIEGFDWDYAPSDASASVRRESLREFLEYHENTKSPFWDHTHPLLRWEPDED